MRGKSTEKKAQPDKEQIQEELLGVSQEEYGDEYEDHAIRQYELLVSAAEKISDRRSQANAFFVTINTAIIGGILGFSSQFGTPTVIYVSLGLGLIGAVICCAWSRLIESYSAHNKGKFLVIHLMEESLPFHPYQAEWLALGEGENPELYRPFTTIEKRVPLLFLLGYVVSVVVSFFFLVWPSISQLA